MCFFDLSQGENTGRENNSGDDCPENADECYVHEGFLADWRPGVSNHSLFGRPCFNLRDKPVYDMRNLESTQATGKLNNNLSGEAQKPNGSMHEIPFVSNQPQNPYAISNFTGVGHYASSTVQENPIVSDMASKSTKSQIYLPPYRARRSNNARLVKLAPDLPPVNLPPSVRVISQSAYAAGASKKASTSGGCCGDPRDSHVAQPGASHSVKTGKDKRIPGEEEAMKLNSNESCVVKDKHGKEERSTESDLQMHPLLFQAPENGRLPYYPSNCSNNISSSFSFSSGNQPQLNLSLFHNPQVNRAVDSFNRFLKTKESNTSCGIDFHPLLTRTEDTNIDSPSVKCPGIGVVSDQCQRPFTAVQKKSLGSGSPLPTERANELDLEIHLSSTSAKTKASGSTTDATTHIPMQPTDSVANPGDSTNYQDTDHLHISGGQNFNNVIPDACASALTSTDLVGDNDDYSQHEIVMEQEELSDSDEEIEEDVEFECEEMADSDGEMGSESDQVTEMQDKVITLLLFFIFSVHLIIPVMVFD